MNSITPDKLTPLTCDLHVHSALSSCAEDNMTPKEVLKKILNFGIDIFSITDHNSGFNCAAFEEAAKDHDILFIPGIELQSSEEIHLLGYFPDIQMLNNFCSTIVEPRLPTQMKNDPLRFGHQIKINRVGNPIGEENAMLSMPLNISIDELVDQVHNFNGIAVAAHLGRGLSVISQLGFIPPQLKLDAVEIWDISKIESIKSNFLTNKKFNIISSSDSHYLHMMKKPKMKLWLKNADVKSCLNCIKGDGAGRITISQKTVRDFKKTKESILDSNESVSPRDWKNLYK
jgi:predicted metal-dependent phosphoesterase TrpH